MSPLTMYADKVAEREGPLCKCGHPWLAHVTVHEGGCIGIERCAPDCHDECDADGCGCRRFAPRSPSSGTGDGE